MNPICNEGRKENVLAWATVKQTANERDGLGRAGVFSGSVRPPSDPGS